MQKKFLWIGLAVALAAGLKVNAQNAKQDSTYKRWFVGSSLLMFGNFDKTNNPEYILLNAGYRITPKDIVSVRFERYIYASPKGIPLGPSLDAPELNYPGHGRIIAPSIGYQKLWWKGLYTSIHILNAFEKYTDENTKKIGNGFTLYLDTYLGYQFNFCKGRFFFDPAIGISYWPVRTGVPDSFNTLEQKWPKYFIQPGLDLGFRF